MSLAYDYAMNRYNNKHSDNDYISPHLIVDAINDEHWQAAKENLFGKMDYRVQQVLLVCF